MTSTRLVTRATGSSAVPQLIFGDLWEYDPAPETADPRLKARYELFIGGKFVAPKSNKYFDSINPATEETLAEIALANQADVDAAYQAAQKAFGAWSKLPGAERGKYLYRIARLIQDRILSAREVMSAHLRQIARLNPKINAIVAKMDDEKCLALAETSDRQRASDQRLGPLHRSDGRKDKSPIGPLEEDPSLQGQALPRLMPAPAQTSIVMRPQTLARSEPLRVHLPQR